MLEQYQVIQGSHYGLAGILLHIDTVLQYYDTYDFMLLVNEATRCVKSEGKGCGQFWKISCLQPGCMEANSQRLKSMVGFWSYITYTQVVNR